jgi:hypothetical protein
VHTFVDFLCGLLISGICAGFFGFAIVSVYERLRSQGDASDSPDRRVRTAFVTAIFISTAVGVLGFAARFCWNYLSR